MKQVNRIFCATLAAATVFAAFGGTALADQDVQVGPGTANANLDFRVIIPVLTRLRIGSPVAINRIDFDLGTVGAPAPGDGVDVTAANGGSGGYPAPGTTAVTVQLVTTVAAGVTVNQSAVNPTGLVGLAVPANIIPWTQILIADSGGGFTHTGGTLTGALTPIFTGGPGLFNGTWTFAYDNATFYPADQYDGTIQYTVTNP